MDHHISFIRCYNKNYKLIIIKSNVECMIAYGPWLLALSLQCSANIVFIIKFDEASKSYSQTSKTFFFLKKRKKNHLGLDIIKFVFIIIWLALRVLSELFFLGSWHKKSLKHVTLVKVKWAWRVILLIKIIFLFFQWIMLLFTLISHQLTWRVLRGFYFIFLKLLI
jgi:hypothetical protein